MSTCIGLIPLARALTVDRAAWSPIELKRACDCLGDEAGASHRGDKTTARDGGCRIKSFAKTWAAFAVTAAEGVGSDAAGPAALCPRNESRPFGPHP